MTDLKPLEDTIAVYGGDVSRWPDGRAEALRDLCDSAEGRALLARETVFDGLLDHAGSEASDDHHALMSRIMDQTAETTIARRAVSREQVNFGRRSSGWIGAGLMAASLVIGVFAGWNGLGVGIDRNGLMLGTGTQVAQLDDIDDPLLSDLVFPSGIDLEDESL